MVRICVIALVGLPAAGKTTFCNTFIESFNEYDCTHICYDQMFTFKPHDNVSSYKESRRKVLQKVEQVIIRIQLNETPDRLTLKSHIILCDDNNYYTGMRYEIYKLCKNHQLSFGQIYFPLNLSEALQRNCVRNPTEKLPSSVIELMNHRLEIPSPKNKWESNTFTFQDASDLNELRLCVEAWLNNPLSNACKTTDGISQHSSVIHEIDILLRRRIKQLVQEFDGNLSERAKMLNETRKSILRELEGEQGLEGDLDVDSIIKRLK